MKRVILIICLVCGSLAAAQAQKFALVDMEYVLKNIPNYETANEQLSMISKKWQKEVEAKMQELQTMQQNYQTELIFLSDDMKTKREGEILAKEKEANELKRKYFGMDGELFKKRESLIKPIQDDVYTAIQEVAKEKGYDMVSDKSSAPSLLYSAPRLDISDLVLQKLGYSK